MKSWDGREESVEMSSQDTPALSQDMSPMSSQDSTQMLSQDMVPMPSQDSANADTQVTVGGAVAEDESCLV